MNFIKTSLCLVAVLLLSGCTADKTPSQVYEEYNAKVIAGIDFDEEKAYFSTRKQAEVESKMPRYMKTMKKSPDEVIQVYL